MNLILLEKNEVALGGLPANDPRAIHLRDVLKSKIGDNVCVGEVNGRRGLATIDAQNDTGVFWKIAWEELAPVPLPLHLIAGLSRPQTVRKILQDATSLGFAKIHFFVSEKGDPAYAQSSIFRDGEVGQLLRKGASQAFTTLIPEVEIFANLQDAIGAISENETGNFARIFLDIYEAPVPLADAILGHAGGAAGAILAIGPERGWSGAERDFLREKNFAGAHLGGRVLRVETACIAAGAISLAMLAKTGCLASL